MKKSILILLMVTVSVVAFAKGTKEEPVIITNEDPAYLSPNGDGIQDGEAIKLKMTLYLRSESGYVPEYGIQIISVENEEVMKEVKGKEKRDIKLVEQWAKEFEPFTLEREIYWDGKDQYGEIVADGVYDVVGWVEDSSRNTSEMKIGEYIVDNSVPTVSITTGDKKIFSPNYDDRYDTADFSMQSSNETLWVVTVEDLNSTVIRTENISDSELTEFGWDGTDDSGIVAFNGFYTLNAVSTDEAGNTSGKVTSDIVELIVEDTQITATPEFKGFSPNADGVRDNLNIAIEYTKTERVLEWQWAIKDSNSDKVFFSTNGAGELPTVITLDGMTPSGAEFPEGYYDFLISCLYDYGNKPAAICSFAIDRTAPTVGLESTNNPFIKTLSGDVKGDLFIGIDADDNMDFVDWDLEIVDKDGVVVKVFAGIGDPTSQVAWNEAAGNAPETFELRIKVTDIGGNESLFTKPITLDVLVIERDGRYYLMVPNIIFEAYKSELDSKPDMYESNIESIKRVYDIYNKYPGYKLILEAHALNVFEEGSEQYETEEAVLIPLTKERAEKVKLELLELGMEESLIKEEAWGGKDPLADPSDKTVRWKNRRVEFVMEMTTVQEIVDELIEKIVQDEPVVEEIQEGDLF